jgi:hypothetical protein
MRDNAVDDVKGEPLNLTQSCGSVGNEDDMLAVVVPL